MLLTCPECELQVSDKALTCPHCGFPFQKNTLSRNRKSNRHRRLPNGFGQITEIKDRNLRRPYRVLITVGKTPQGRPIAKPLQPQSYFETYNDAYAALVEYNKNPYSLESNITMQELFEKWIAEHTKEVQPETIQKNRCEWNYISSIHHLPLSQVRTPELKLAFDHLAKFDEDGTPVPLPRTIKVRIKNILNLMYDYALSNDLITQNYARSFALPKEEVVKASTPEKEHISFTDAEVAAIEQIIDTNPAMQILYIQFYSGWRPDELLDMRVKNVNLEERWFKGGSKTEAGKDRIVPIHPKIFPYVKQNYLRAKETDNEYLFTKVPAKGNNDTHYSYHQYYRLFVKARDELGLNPDHRPHDGRVYFATTAKKSGVDEYALKEIMGHRIADVTESRYVKRDLAWLAKELKKIQ